MKLRDWAFAVAGASAALLTYGCLYEANRLIVERRTLRLRGWKRSLSGFKIAFLSDFHLRGPYSMDLAKHAVALAIDEGPDMVVLGGDLVAYWRADSENALAAVLEPLILMDGNVVAVPGNREYRGGTPERLRAVLDVLNVRLLRNECWHHAGINWIGIDSANEHKADPIAALQGATDGAAIVLWHEPDMVDTLPFEADLMLSGHSHGGQFRFPGGLTPMHSVNGRKYLSGFFPDTKVPLYVTRGVGTTGPPSRFLCPPEVSILTLVTG
ncbi:MAG: metallophosphoesterase [Fimbriimonadaceae bacterium]|nr:metallophosphoesterase [Fimbriimonadaceae bacterium]